MPTRLARIAGIAVALACAGSLPAAERVAERAPVRAVLEVLGAEARFVSGEAALAVTGEAALQRLIERLSRHGELLSIRVVGHADSTGSSEANLRLSARRAAYVGRAISRRYPTVPLISIGAGESSPLASNATDEGRARNRRVEIHVVAKPDVRR